MGKTKRSVNCNKMCDKTGKVFIAFSLSILSVITYVPLSFYSFVFHWLYYLPTFLSLSIKTFTFPSLLSCFCSWHVSYFDTVNPRPAWGHSTLGDESLYRWSIAVQVVYHCIGGLQFNKSGFDQKENVSLFVCSEAVESKLADLETSHTVILSPTVSVLCPG